LLAEAVGYGPAGRVPDKISGTLDNLGARGGV